MVGIRLILSSKTAGIRENKTMSNTKIPVILLTGFLGSGKTTLLNRLLADGVKTAVVINEFGSAPVDQDLLEQQDIPLTVLSGGCLCCRIRGALAPTLKNLRMAWDGAEHKPFQRIIIETSGVASPEPIIDTLLRERWLSSRYRLQAVLCALAIPGAPARMARFPEALAQVVWADSLILTHGDLSSGDELEPLEQQLRQLAPAATRFIAVRGQIEPAKLLTIERPFRRLPLGLDVVEHGYGSFSLYFDEALAWHALHALLQGLLVRHDNLVRIKGVVFLPEQADPIAVQAAMAALYPPRLLPARGGGDRCSRLVFIVVGALEPVADDLRNRLGYSLGKYALCLH